MRSCLKYHGGKYYLRHKLLELMPPHTTYVEPFFGGGQFFFFKPPSAREIIGDKDYHLVWLWHTIQTKPLELGKILGQLPYCESSFKWAQDTGTTHNWNLAARKFILLRQSLGARGKSFAKPSSGRTRRGMPDNESAWLSALDLIVPNSERLKNVDIYAGEAIGALAQYDAVDTLYYLDPPYLPETRVSKKVYNNEMSYEDHEQLLDTILGLKGHVMISGYDSPLYNDKLRGWRREEVKMANHSSNTKVKKRSLEVIWNN